MMSDKYAATDVFTPTKPARLTFVERAKINEKLVNALTTPGKQIVVYGHSGSGKTTLLVNKLDQTYENHVTTRCVAGLTFEQVMLEAFDQLEPFYTEERTQSRRSGLSASLTSTYIGIKSQLSSSSGKEEAQKEKRLLPPQLTPQTLARLLGEARCCWVLEDFHKIDPKEKIRLSQCMKVFMDMADQHSDVRIIAIGAADTARQVVEYDPEMQNRVAEIHVPLMSEAEIRGIMSKGEQCLNFSIDSPVKEGIVRYSNGLAAVCHNLCLNLCNAAGIRSTLDSGMDVGGTQLREALDQYFEGCSDTLKAAFDKALSVKRRAKFDNCRLILRALTEFGQTGAPHSEILKAIRKREAGYPAGNCTHYLHELETPQRGSLLHYDSASRRYSFTDPLYRAFALVLFEKDIGYRRLFVGAGASAFTGALRTHFEEVILALERALSQVDKRTSGGSVSK